MAQYAVQLSKGETVYINEADAYQFEGPLTTFFATGSSRQVIDSWSTRVASYRTTDIVAIERFDLILPMDAGEPPSEPMSVSMASDPHSELDIRGLMSEPSDGSDLVAA